MISAYERGHRQPAVPTLAALVDTAGFESDIQVLPVPSRLDPLTGPIGRRLRQHRQELLSAAPTRGVQNPRVFGSVVRGQDQPDLDLLADLPSAMGFLGLGQVRDEFEAIIGVRVDLVPAGDLKPRARPGHAGSDRAVTYREQQRLSDIVDALHGSPTLA